jgi:N-carbamoyl-L-amino-acid hydrolase
MGLTSAKSSVRHIVTPDNMSLQINGSRVWNEILETSLIGGIPGTTGMNRLALSQDDKAVRDLFKARATEIGCDIAIDEIGNIFAILPGRDNTLPPIGIGSHLDTQSKGIANSMGLFVS